MLIFSTLTSARGRRVLHHSQARPAAGPLGTRLNTALSPHGPGGGLPRTWPAGPRPWRPRYARQSISQSQGGVSTCTVTARSAGPPSHQARGPPTGQARRHAQDITAPAPPPTGDSDGGIGATGPGTGQPTSAHSGGSTGNPGYVPPKSRQEICCSRPGLLSPEITPINTARPAPATPTKRSMRLGFNARFSAPTLPPRENGRRRSSSLPWVGFQDVRRPLSSVVRCLPWRP